MRRALIIIFNIFFLLLVKVGFAQQTIESLEQEINKAQREIEKSQKLLSHTRDEKSDNITRLKLAQTNIRNRKNIIINLNKQINLLSGDISKNNSAISNLSKELIELKSDYINSVQNRYKDIKQSNFMLFLFSAKDFYDMQRRSEYLERIANFTKTKGEAISQKSSEIRHRNLTLIDKNRKMENLRVSRTDELESLRVEEDECKKLILLLEKDEIDIAARIREQAYQINQLQNKIEKMIKDVAGDKGNMGAVDREALAAMSLKFAENKGSLSPPIEGVITSYFGVHSDPLQKNVKVKNNGVNITPTELNVKSIFAGEVVKVFFFQGLNNSVMIRHGSYLSVYSNMGKVYVESGDMVGPGQKIGSLTNGANQTVHFELWKETEPLDPTLWIKF